MCLIVDEELTKVAMKMRKEYPEQTLTLLKRFALGITFMATPHMLDSIITKVVRANPEKISPSRAVGRHALAIHYGLHAYFDFDDSNTLNSHEALVPIVTKWKHVHYVGVCHDIVIDKYWFAHPELLPVKLK